TPAIALLGCGVWGRNIARVLAGLGALHTICDSNTDVGSTMAKELGVGFTNDPQSVLDDENIMGIAIATPAITHAEMTRRALGRNKHVFVEKPIALSMAEARAVADDAVAKGRVLMVGHLLQYHPVFVKLLELVKAGNLGKIRYVSSHRLNLGRIRTE